MRFKNPTVDRIWLWIIAIAFTMWLPIWLILRIEDYGLMNVALFFLALFLIGLWRAWPTDRPSREPSNPQRP